MTRKKAAKPYWEMNSAELREATQEFDKELVADKAGPLTRVMRARWQRARTKKSRDSNGRQKRTISVRLDSVLLDRCADLAKRKRVSQDALIARGLKALLAAEGLG